MSGPMSDQPYEPYEPYEGTHGETHGQQYPGGYQAYDPYQQPQGGHPQQYQGRPRHATHPQAQQHYQQQYAAAQYTQQWEGETWDTQVQSAAQYPQQAQQAHLPGPSHEPRPAAPEPEPAPAPRPPLTAAQRARAEGRSPIIEPGMQPAALTALLGLLLSGAAAVGSWALLVPLVLLQAVTAAGWFRLNGMWPARQGIALAFAGGLTADAVLMAAGRDHGPAAILGTLGVWVLLSLVLQLRSHADPDERLYGLMATVVSAALAVVATGWLAAEADAVTIGAAAVAVAILARALPLPTPVSVVVSLLAGAGAGIAVGDLTGAGAGADGAVLGAAAAVCALVGHRVASYDYPSRFVHFTAGVALPLSAAAPVVWVLGRALG